MSKEEKTYYVAEIKKYKTVDGMEFATKAEAERHAKEISDPETRLIQAENKILELEAEIATLSARITALEAKKSFPWGQPHPDVTPFGPYQQPFNPMIPTPKLPSEPGDVVYDAVELSKLSDEELKKKGYDVVYVGHKRSVIPHVTEFDFNKEKTNNSAYTNSDKQ